MSGQEPILWEGQMWAVPFFQVGLKSGPDNRVLIDRLRDPLTGPRLLICGLYTKALADAVEDKSQDQFAPPAGVIRGGMRVQVTIRLIDTTKEEKKP